MFDMTRLGLGTGNTAWVGLTGATGGGVDNQDILSWTFTPQAESAPVTTGTPTDFNFQSGFNNGGYDYTAQLTQGSPVTAQVTRRTVARSSAYPATKSYRPTGVRRRSVLCVPER